jgi:alkyl sulfatase BDS1-like metallo-beta-lactamase superfamily hydrolase
MTKKEIFLKKIASGTIRGRDLLLFVDAVGEVGNINEGALSLLADLKEEHENLTLNFELPEVKLVASLIIKDGVLTTPHKLAPKPDVTITILSEDTAQKIILGQLGMLEAYKQGKILAKGNLAKVLALGILLNVVGDEFGVL